MTKQQIEDIKTWREIFIRWHTQGPLVLEDLKADYNNKAEAAVALMKKVNEAEITPEEEAKIMTALLEIKEWMMHISLFDKCFEAAAKWALHQVTLESKAKDFAHKYSREEMTRLMEENVNKKRANDQEVFDQLRRSL